MTGDTALGSPLVSVVVPTIDRAGLVTRAVRSVLGQTLRPIEVVVVVNGPDPATVDALARIDAAELRVVGLPEWAGVGGARMAGIAAARSPWIALLDDDDEWLPPKLEIQLETARRSAPQYPVISCRFVDRRSHGDTVAPPRAPAAGEPLSEYLFCRPSLLVSDGAALPSTMLFPKALAIRVPFRHARFAHEGSDWLLRAALSDGVGFEFVATREPLVIRHAEGSHKRASAKAPWRASVAWARENAHLLTPRAHAAFLLNQASLEARRGREMSAAWRLVWEAFRRGRPTRTALLTHVILWLVPERVRFAILASLRRNGHDSHTLASMRDPARPE